MLAVGAGGVGQHQIEGRPCWLGLQLQDFPCLYAPFALHYLGQAVDQYIEETADQQAESQYDQNKGRQIAGQKINQIHDLYDRAQLEDGKVHGDDQTAHQYTQYGHDHGLHQCSQAVDHIVDFLFIKGRNFIEH